MDPHDEAAVKFAEAFADLARTAHDSDYDPLVQALAILNVATAPKEQLDYDKFPEEVAHPILHALLNEAVLNDPYWRNKLIHVILFIEYALADLKKEKSKKMTKYYWLAVKGKAVPAASLPFTEEEMRAMDVHVGASPAEPTLWGIGPSNYDVLIGFKTLDQQRRSQDILLNAPKPEMDAEVVRQKNEEIIIWRLQ